MSEINANFKISVQQYLNKLASKDLLFAESLKNENKSIDKCVKYILNTAKKTKKIEFTEEEIINMAVWYYNDEFIKNINVKLS